jgi:hypothetical protein
VRMQVRLDGRVLFTSTVRLGHLTRQEAEEDNIANDSVFFFKAGRSIKWKGYRDDAPTTSPKKEIECDIWMAGADPRFVIIGVDVSYPTTIFMNTVHFVELSKESISEVEPGLEIITSPTAERNPSNQSTDPACSSDTPAAGQPARHP